MDNNDDFSMFASSERVTSKQNETQKKSPFSVSTSALREPIINKVESELQKREVEAKQPVQHNFKNNSEEETNVGTELQKLRKYPVRTFDKCINKMVSFNDEEYFMIREFAADISIARKKIKNVNKDTLPRITENTIIRAGLKVLLKKVGSKNIDFNSIQTEEGLENLFASLMN